VLRTLLSLAAVLSVAAGVVCAQEGTKSTTAKKTIEQQFSGKDANKDGRLSLAEYKGKETNKRKLARLDKMFKALDVDGDGFVTFAEFKTYCENKAADRKLRWAKRSEKQSDNNSR
jgi:hypothetical protein